MHTIASCEQCIPLPRSLPTVRCTVEALAVKVIRRQLRSRTGMDGVYTYWTNRSPAQEQRKLRYHV